MTIEGNIDKYFIESDQEVLMTNGKILRASSLHNNRRYPYVSFQNLTESMFGFRVGRRGVTEFNFELLNLINEHNLSGGQSNKIHARVVLDVKNNKRSFLVPPDEVGIFKNLLVVNANELRKHMKDLGMVNDEFLHLYPNFRSFLKKYDSNSNNYKRAIYPLPIDEELILDLRLQGKTAEQISQEIKLSKKNVCEKLRIALSFLNTAVANPESYWPKAEVEIALRKLFRDAPEYLAPLIEDFDLNHQKCARLIYESNMTVRDLIKNFGIKNVNTIRIMRETKRMLITSAISEGVVNPDWIDQRSIEELTPERK